MHTVFIFEWKFSNFGEVKVLNQIITLVKVAYNIITILAKVFIRFKTLTLRNFGF